MSAASHSEGFDKGMAEGLARGRATGFADGIASAVKVCEGLLSWRDWARLGLEWSPGTEAAAATDYLCAKIAALKDAQP